MFDLASPIPARRALALLALAALGLAGAPLRAQEAPDDGVYKDHIDWGILMDLSGPTSSSQGPWVTGFQDYMRKVNEAGGVSGRKVNVLAEDNRFNAAADKIAFEKLVSQTPVIAISGMGNSASQVGVGGNHQVWPGADRRHLHADQGALRAGYADGLQRLLRI